MDTEMPGWLKHVRAILDNDLCYKEYALKHNISEYKISSWIGQYYMSKQEVENFIEVDTSEAKSLCRISLSSGGEIEINDKDIAISILSDIKDKL